MVQVRASHGGGVEWEMFKEMMIITKFVVNQIPIVY